METVSSEVIQLPIHLGPSMKRFLALFAVLISLFFAPLPNAGANQGPIEFVIDISGSMKGEKISAVKSAVAKIINSLEDNQQVGIITFSNRVREILPPTLNHARSVEKIKALYAGGETALYDATLAAVASAQKSGASQIILLSDGEDSSSQANLKSTLLQVSDANIPVSTIGVQIEQVQREILTKISTKSGGLYYGVEDTSKLIDAYRQILRSQTFGPKPSPSEAKANATLHINVNPYLRFVSSLIGAIAVAYISLLFIRWNHQRHQRRKRIESIQKYSYRQVRKATARLRVSITSYSFIPNRVESWIRLRLELIHSKQSYETVIKLMIIGFIFLTLILNAILQIFLLSLILSVGLVHWGFHIITKKIREDQIKEFADELPELLNLLASALRSGLNLQQGLEAYSVDSKSEVGREIRRAIGEIRVGTPLDEALMGVADRMKNDDLTWAVTALSIQRIVGGSMATILTTTYETVKARAEIRREVRTLAAEGKLSAYVLMALPIGIFSFLFLTRREYVKVFWTDPAGIFLLLVIAGTMTIGWTWMKKIVDIKI